MDRQRTRLGTEPPPGKFHDMKQTLLEEFERDYLVRCLEAAEMNVSLASRYSGLSRKHIRTLMAKYNIVVRRELAISSLDVDLDIDDALPAT
jgi:DNA-binding NtrC family response regulator